MYDYATRQEQLNIKTEIQQVHNDILDLNNNIVSISDDFRLLLICISVILCVKFIESFVDTMLHNRK